MLHRDAVVTMEFVNSAIRAQGAASYLIDASVEQGRDVFEALFTQIANLPDVLRANVYARDRSIIWSSNPRLIGVEFTTNRELDQALGGKLAIAQGLVGEVKKAEHAFLEGIGPPVEQEHIYTRDRLWSSRNAQTLRDRHEGSAGRQRTVGFSQRDSARTGFQRRHSGGTYERAL